MPDGGLGGKRPGPPRVQAPGSAPAKKSRLSLATWTLEECDIPHYARPPFVQRSATSLAPRVIAQGQHAIEFDNIKLFSADCDVAEGLERGVMMTVLRTPWRFCVKPVSCFCMCHMPVGCLMN